MNRDQIIDLLSAMTARDNRNAGDSDIDAWLEDVGGLDFEDALTAVRMHYRDSTEWLMPAHIRRIVKRLRDERLAAAPELAPPVDPADEETYRQALADIRRRAGSAPPPFNAIASAKAKPSEPSAYYRQMRRRAAKPGERRSNRDAVLAYPDLAKRLTEPPIDYERPEQWNGFVPPTFFDQQRFDSYRRDALAALVAEAHQRDEASA